MTATPAIPDSANAEQGDRSGFPDVLLIDDSSFIHSLLEKKLGHEPINLHGARSAAEGLEMAERIRPALILLDLTMPEIDGFQALRRIKDTPGLMDSQVIVISSSDDTEDKVAGLELGACDYVTKPFNMPELRARMRSALRMHEVLALLAERAQVDGLTGIGNRSSFDDRLAEELSHRERAGAPLTVAMCDIDFFKKVNDTFGHAAGDEVIRGFARIFTQSLRKSDIPFRFGGEEFAILLRDTSAEQAAPVLERVRQTIEQTRWPAHPEHMVTCSFGLCDQPAGDPKKPLSWIKTADEALYAAKKAGRNRIFVADSKGQHSALKLAS
ncbi:MAG: diguanylate cyclase [Phycisphaeraceae bacterium]|nr:diguanylate cyclase [Phycisphaeraceae bacterium]